MKKYVITKTSTCYSKEATILVSFENDIPLDFSIVYDNEDTDINNIYVGHVKDVVKNINSAFVDYEKGKTAYLPLHECKNPIFINRKNTDKICQSDNVLVQLIKEPVKTKFGVLTTDITFSGRYVVFCADNQGNISISNKIKDKDFSESIQKAFEDFDNTYSFIIRTAAYNTDFNNVISEARYFIEKYEKIKNIALFRPAYSLIHKATDVNISLIKDTICDGDEIVTDSLKIAEEIKENLYGYDYSLRMYNDEFLPLYKLYNIEGIIKNISSTNIWLKSGAYIVIEYTEAMTVVDVNTGKFIKGKSRDDTFLKINIEAAHEILRQLRLRNISGIIICDFINMSSDEDELMLMNEIKNMSKNDRIPINVLGFTKLKLLEMTRKKLRDRVIIKKESRN